MKSLTRFFVLIFVTLVLFLTVFFLLFVLHYIDPHSVLQFMVMLYIDETLRRVVVGLAGFVILANYICYYQAVKANISEKKIIAFDNPGGRVSVSLLAIEELTKRVISRFSEVREVKSRVWVSKKGLHIKMRLILRAEGSIPEVTSRVQDAVKRKIQDTIGIDEPIDVDIYVGKILPDQANEKRPPKKDDGPKVPEQQPNIPFQGYRA
jgi:uncharacterized alkaline shock family protein YloU